MTILFLGGEMGAFTPSDNTVYESTVSPGRFNPSFARCSVYAETGLSFADSMKFTATADLWCHIEISQNGSFNGSSTKVATIEFLDNAGVAKVRLATDTPVSGSPTGNWEMQYWNGSTWVATGGFSASVMSLQTIDIHAVVNSASGSLKLYLSGTLRSDSGTIDLSGIASLAQVRLWGKTVAIGSPLYHSQVIVADEPTIGWRLLTVPATGTGATTDWTGTYAEIDEITYSDADFVNSPTANQVELFTHSTAIPTGYTVRAVGVTARAKKGASGPANLQFALRSAGTTYFSSSKALDFGYGAFVNIWETDPATSAAFTSSAIPSLQFGVKSIT